MSRRHLSLRRRRRPVASLTCPGCGRTGLIPLGLLERIPAHKTPRREDEPERQPDGTCTPRPSCKWAGDPFPGRPDGVLYGVDARWLTEQLDTEQRQRVSA